MSRNSPEARAVRPDAALRRKVAWLSDPRHYPGTPRTVAAIETHFAWIFLAGRRAYKLKKPLRRASLDHRTVARRKRACLAELRLNRRLAPDVYLRVVPLSRGQAGSLHLQGRLIAGARVADWLVEMRRLDATRTLDRAIAAGRLRPRDIEGLAARLAAFFRRARRRPLSDGSYRARLRREILGNAAQLCARDLGLSRATVLALARAQLDFLVRAAGALAGRGARLVDGHGDLRPEHVFLGNSSAGVRVIDCLEFDPDLRRLDPAEEIAFLALECDRLGAPAAAARLIAGYREFADDPVPPALLHFYMSRRAALRAQIAAWHLRDAAFAGQSRAWIARARSYLADGRRHIERAMALSPLSASVRGSLTSSR